MFELATDFSKLNIPKSQFILIVNYQKLMHESKLKLL